MFERKVQGNVPNLGLKSYTIKLEVTMYQELSQLHSLIHSLLTENHNLPSPTARMDRKSTAPLFPHGAHFPGGRQTTSSSVMVTVTPSARHVLYFRYFIDFIPYNNSGGHYYPQPTGKDTVISVRTQTFGCQCFRECLE